MRLRFSKHSFSLSILLHCSVALKSSILLLIHHCREDELTFLTSFLLVPVDICWNQILGLLFDVELRLLGYLLHIIVLYTYTTHFAWYFHTVKANHHWSTVTFSFLSPFLTVFLVRSIRRQWITFSVFPHIHEQKSSLTSIANVALSWFRWAEHITNSSSSISSISSCFRFSLSSYGGCCWQQSLRQLRETEKHGQVWRMCQRLLSTSYGGAPPGVERTAQSHWRSIQPVHERPCREELWSRRTSIGETD